MYEFKIYGNNVQELFIHCHPQVIIQCFMKAVLVVILNHLENVAIIVYGKIFIANEDFQSI